MDYSRFDRLSQMLVTTHPRSRRGVLAVLGVAFAGALAGVDPDSASAKRPSRQHRTRKTRQHAPRGHLRAAASGKCTADTTCPHHLVCRKGKCLTSCNDDLDCTDGLRCDWATGRCVSEFACDCANLNDCSGHGICTETCTCLCDEGWSGSACSDQPALACGDFTTCETCQIHLREGCTWCAATLDGAVGVCVSGDVCIEPVEIC